MSKSSFCAFILSHGRPNNVRTYETLRRCGYSGDIRIIIDNLDGTQNQYKEKYPNEIIIFDKEEASKITDSGDADKSLRSVLYARNMVHAIAEAHGYDYFVELDDDYTSFLFRFDNNLKPYLRGQHITNLDKVFQSLVEFLEVSGAYSVAVAQGGDFIGGGQNRNLKRIRCLRKTMNSFVCKTSRPFKFLGRMNDDVSMYVVGGSRGELHLTTTQIMLNQGITQANAGGLTELYLDMGTYVKSYYSIMFHPSSVSIRMMGGSHRRVHHHVAWNNTVPKIIRQVHKKM